MPDAAVIALAEAVKDALNDAAAAPYGSLSQPFTAVRGYTPTLGRQEEDADELATLRVLVMPRELAMTVLSRRDDDFDYAVDIGVFKRIGPGRMTDDETNAACDPLMLLVEEIADLFRGLGVLADIPARFLGLENAPVFDPALLAERRVFASLITLRFKKARPR